MKIPYGLADFYDLVTRGYVYVDRTRFIGQLEELGRALLFIRPRRFGKSLWLQTLRCYYDLRLADEHEKLFGNLAVGRAPTPLAHRYFVLVWNFSGVPARGSPDEIETRLASYVNNSVRSFAKDYQEYFSEPISVEEDPFATLGNLLASVRATPYRLYLLIDEYDNFANEVMVTSERVYQRLVHADGPFKQLFKWVKLATEGQGLERLFVTGVSPVVMSDLTSGLNICENVYLLEELNELCGFTEEEVRDLLTPVAGEGSVEGALDMMRTWYDGYRFAPGAGQEIYNPTLALYFLKHLQRTGAYPREMLDVNLSIDQDKLRYIGQIATGRKVVIDVLETGMPIEVSKLEERFTLVNILDRTRQDQSFLASFLYYFGMLTLLGESARRKLLLAPPNLVTKTLYVDQVRQFLLPSGADRSAAAAPVEALTGEGEIEPLLAFVEQRLFKTFSNRDYLRMSELALKAVFVTLIFDDVSYVMYSEPELDRGHADLCLLLRPDARSADLWDLLLEFKYIPLRELEMEGVELRAADRAELLRLDAVAKALARAEEQLRRYRRALLERHGKQLRLRCYSVVALGFDRLIGRELPLNRES